MIARIVGFREMRDNEKARGSVKKEFDELRRRIVWGEKHELLAYNINLLGIPLPRNDGTSLKLLIRACFDIALRKMLILRDAFSVIDTY